MSEARASETHYPLVLTNLAHVRCVVVGGGAVAERKVRDLIAGGARPIVVSPQLTQELDRWRMAGMIEHRARVYVRGDLDGAILAIAATDDSAVNAAVGGEGARLGILVNVADAPARGNFHTMATLRRGKLVFAISTSGGSPALTAHLRRQIEAQYGDEYGILLALLVELRAEARHSLSRRQQAQLWRDLISDELLELLRAGQADAAASIMRARLEALRNDPARVPDAPQE
jgi:siroheme synthase-like protein